MRNGGDVIVVGAGIVGSSTAYHLAAGGTAVTLARRAASRLPPTAYTWRP
jgi:sarcosine oxidase subunit beta